MIPAVGGEKKGPAVPPDGARARPEKPSRGPFAGMVSQDLAAMY